MADYRSDTPYTSEKPDPEVDFNGYLEWQTAKVLAEMEANPEPEYWLAKSAMRVVELQRLKAPSSILARAKKTLRAKCAALLAEGE